MRSPLIVLVIGKGAQEINGGHITTVSLVFGTQTLAFVSLEEFQWMVKAVGGLALEFEKLGHPLRRLRIIVPPSTSAHLGWLRSTDELPDFELIACDHDCVGHTTSEEPTRHGCSG
jgi:hypothetical protein